MESQSGAVPEIVVPTIPAVPTTPLQQASYDTNDGQTVYPCYVYGTSNRTLQRLCPRTKDPTAKGETLPANFHLTIEEGERRDWLGPLGLTAFAGTFKASLTGDSTRSNPVLLRGANQLKYLSFRLVDLGYDPYIAQSNGMAFAVCKLHPHRSRELYAAAMHNRRSPFLF